MAVHDADGAVASVTVDDVDALIAAEPQYAEIRERPGGEVFLRSVVAHRRVSDAAQVDDLLQQLDRVRLLKRLGLPVPERGYVEMPPLETVLNRIVDMIERGTD